jgi:hypothetical protein
MSILRRTNGEGPEMYDGNSEYFEVISEKNLDSQNMKRAEMKQPGPTNIR